MTEPKIPKVWAKVDQIYQPALKEENIHIAYDLNESGISYALELENQMNFAISGVEKQTGISRKEVLADPVKKQALSKALKEDEGWNFCFKNICEFFSPNLDLREAANDIDRPFWNNLQFGFISDDYDPSKSPDYHVNSNISHSFLTQLKEATKAKYGVEKLQPVSVVSDLITADNKLVLGHRGGNNHYDVIMNIFAGSIEPHLKPGERGALFGSSDKENGEELSLKPEDFKSSELIARVEERLLAPGGWQYYVFRNKVNMELDELVEHWKKAVDREEHRRLVFYDAKDPSILLSSIKYNHFDVNKVGERTTQTTPGNIGAFLPQCSGTVLAHFVAERGYEWAANTEKYLDGHYDLTSCFKTADISKD